MPRIQWDRQPDEAVEGAWVARYLGGQDPRVEVIGTLRTGNTVVTLLVRLQTVRVSMSGPAVFSGDELFDMMQTVIEARDVLLRG